MRRKIVVRFLRVSSFPVVVRNIGIVLGNRLKARKRAGRPDRGALRIPESIYVYPTMQCNLRCVGCLSSKFEGGDMDREKLGGFLSAMIRRGVNTVTFLGGEPLLPSVQETVFSLAAVHRYVRFPLFTNGTIQDEATIARIKAARNVFVFVSIDGDPAAHDGRRGPGAYDKATAFCKKLAEEKIPFAISCTVNAANRSYLVSETFSSLAKELGAVFVLLLPYCPVGCSGDDALMLKKSHLEEMHRAAAAINRKADCVYVDAIRSELALKGCMAGLNRIAVMPTGDVLPCPGIHFSYANILRDPLETVLGHPFIRDLDTLKRQSKGCLVIGHLNELDALIRKYADVKATTDITSGVIETGGIASDD